MFKGFHGGVVLGANIPICFLWKSPIGVYTLPVSDTLLYMHCVAAWLQCMDVIISKKTSQQAKNVGFNRLSFL